MADTRNQPGQGNPQQGGQDPNRTQEGTRPDENVTERERQAGQNPRRGQDEQTQNRPAETERKK